MAGIRVVLTARHPLTSRLAGWSGSQRWLEGLWPELAGALRSAGGDPGELEHATTDVDGRFTVSGKFAGCYVSIEDPFLYVAWWSFAIACAVTIAVSFFTRPKSPEALEGLVYRRKGGGR